MNAASRLPLSTSMSFTQPLGEKYALQSNITVKYDDDKSEKSKVAKFVFTQIQRTLVYSDSGGRWGIGKSVTDYFQYDKFLLRTHKL